MRFKAIIFDFDGTLCETARGIINCARYALEAFDIHPSEDDKELEFFIGPPLLVTFQERYGADAQTAEKMVQKYRERYSDKGIFECDLYDGIEDMLSTLRGEGFTLGIASSKPTPFVEKLLAHFGIRQYFDSVCGVSFEADCEAKSSIIARCLAELNAAPEEAFVAGDRNYDIEGARINGIKSCGVLWGYGTKFEFIEAGADFIAEKLADIEAIALGYFEQTEEMKSIFEGNVVHVHLDTVTLTDGKEVSREIVAHNGGVSIVGLTDDNEVLMVRQFRAPYKEVIYEIPAGKLERGEDPFEAAQREFREECGCTAKRFEYIGELYPTPGYCGEIIRIYFATGLEFGEQDLDDDEYLDVYKIPLEQAFERCMNGEFKDAKTQIGIMKIRELIRNGSLS